MTNFLTPFGSSHSCTHRHSTSEEATHHYCHYLTIFSTKDKLINIANNIQEEFDLNLFGLFMKKVTVWDYASITTDSYLALSHDEKEKLIRSYYSDMKKHAK